MDLVLNVNGAALVIDAGPDTRLLAVLREQLDLAGPRFGCGAGDCGACMVLVDGRPVTSCDTPVASIGTSQVMTVEVVSVDEHPGGTLAAAFEAEQAGQCGYCLSGLIVSAGGLLGQKSEHSKTARLTQADVRSALDRHLCRCGAHGRIVRAVLRAQGGVE